MSAVVTERESAALQELVAALQVQAGRAAEVSTTDLPDLIGELCDFIPQGLGPLAERVLRNLVVELVFRVEAAVQVPDRSDRFSRGLVRLTSAPLSQLGEELSAYVADLQRRAAGPRRKHDGREPRVRIAIDYIRKHHARPSLTREEVAGAVRLSKWHLDRLLRRHTGRCFVAHLHEARLGAAKLLLVDPTRAIKEVASTLGYSSVTLFDRHFKRAFGVTPTEWRQSQIICVRHKSCR